MGVQLNIKDARTAELARDLAKQLNKSVTEVVREALEEKKLRREEEIQRIVARVMQITDGLRERWNPETRHMTSKEMMDSIYDENGLPI
jgi:antitoxin VapB